jgi:uroporphyrinogen-III synthase
MRILSTKKLLTNQKELILNAGASFIEYDAIAIKYLKFEVPKAIKNAVFTSQNGVKSFLDCQLEPSRRIKIQDCFCVGDKTKLLLEENGIKVTKIAKNSTELGQYIAKNYKKEPFYYFCGSMRRDELPEILKASENELFEVKTYKTTLNLNKFDQKWDGILFFSPSGVESFSIRNKMDTSVAFCIGETTASEAKKYTKNVVVSNSTSVESVIAKAVNVLKKANSR